MTDRTRSADARVVGDDTWCLHVDDIPHGHVTWADVCELVKKASGGRVNGSEWTPAADQRRTWAWRQEWQVGSDGQPFTRHLPEARLNEVGIHD